MVGKYISVSVKGIPNAGDKEFIAYAAGPVMAETPAVPVASSVTFYNVDENNRSGGVGVGDTLEAYYCYSGTNQEGTSLYQWYYADKADGDYQPIPNATEKTYTVQKEYYKKYLKLGVTPVDAAGAAGTEALSESVPQVGNAAYRAFVSAPTGICDIKPRNFNSLSYIVDGMDGGGRINPWGADAHSFLVDLRRPVRINSSRIKLENSLSYSISCFDEKSSAWKTLVENAEPKTTPEKTFEPTVTRFVRIEFEGNQKNGARLF